MARAASTRAALVGLGFAIAITPSAGCYLSHRLHHDEPSDAGVDAPPPCVEGERTPPVDLLFVVDDSRSMSEEQGSLAREFPAMLEMLLSGDLDGDGARDVPPVMDLHVGVVTPDLGLAGGACGATSPSMGNLESLDRCGGSGRILEHRPGSSFDQTIERFACLASVGVGGCGFEQQLESALRAITRNDSTLPFLDPEGGRENLDNRGFLREDSILAIVVITDEDDGSLNDLDFLPGLTEETRPAEMWTLVQPSLAPISRYVENLAADRGERFVLGVIAGIPPDLAPEGGVRDHDWDAVLADPRMQNVLIPEELDGTGLVASCTTVEGDRANPPRRLIELVSALGERATAQSICQPSFHRVLTALARQVGAALERETCDDAGVGR